MKKIKAFTLAEILITLSIIGVAAALTIPTLIQRTGNEELVSRLQKAYSTLSRATEAVMTEQGSPRIWAASGQNIYESYKAHLRVSKDCGSSGGCFPQLNGGKRYKNLNGTQNASSGWNNTVKADRNTMILSDGTQIIFWENPNPECNGDSYGSRNVCAGISIDTNGAKGPNTAGRDVFILNLKADGLYPGGCDEYGVYCDPASGDINKNAGYGCACKVISEGAMNY